MFGFGWALVAIEAQLLTLFYSLQAGLGPPVHAQHHAGRVGEDQLQLARSRPLPVDAGGAAGSARQRLQLKDKSDTKND